MSRAENAGRLVHVIDDEDTVLRSIDFLLRSEGYHVQQWGDGQAFLSGADKAVRACVLLDIRMPHIDGLQIQEHMMKEGFDFPVILLTGHGDIDLAVRAMKAGALDFFTKPCDRGKLLDSLAQGFRIIDDSEALRRHGDFARLQLETLTEREHEVLDGLACGYPNKTVGFYLGISSRTVEVYRANVMAKLDVRSFADALRIAFAAGLGSDTLWLSTHGIGSQANATIP